MFGSDAKEKIFKIIHPRAVWFDMVEVGICWYLLAKQNSFWGSSQNILAFRSLKLGRPQPITKWVTELDYDFSAAEGMIS